MPRLMAGILALTLICTTLVRSQSAPHPGRTIVRPGVIVVGAGEDRRRWLCTLASRRCADDRSRRCDAPAGLLEAHTHLTIEFTADWNADFIAGLQKRPAEMALDSTVYASRTLLAGFTTHDRGTDQELRQPVDFVQQLLRA